MGSSVLCYMRELITATEGYEKFVVSPAPHSDDKGENRLAKMPSVIVETAFHTNPDDALALQDPLFRTAAMKGVEKGYRLWREGEGCDPLAIGRIADVTAGAGGRATVEVPFKGHPQFPVTLEVRQAGCSAGAGCQGGDVVLTDASPSPLRFQVECGEGGGGSARWRTTLKDADGVKGGASEHRQACVAGKVLPARHAARMGVVL